MQTAFSGAGTLGEATSNAILLSAQMSSSAVLSADASVIVPVSTQFASAGALGASMGTLVVNSVALTGSGNLTASVYTVISLSAAFIGAGTFTGVIAGDALSMPVVLDRIDRQLFTGVRYGVDFTTGDPSVIEPVITRDPSGSGVHEPINIDRPNSVTLDR